jgi:hypothetical protein
VIAGRVIPVKVEAVILKWVPYELADTVKDVPDDTLE